MGVRHMAGAPWHLETLRTTDDRRNKKKCVYYNCEKCTYLIEKCRGSSKCDYYLEEITAPTVRTVIHDTSPIGIPDIHDMFSVGDTFDYYTSTQKSKYRKMTVREIRGNKLVVDFEPKRHGKKRRKVASMSLVYPECVRYIKR